MSTRYEEIMQHPGYDDRVQKKRKNLFLMLTRHEIIKDAAHCFAYWSLRALLAEKDYADLCFELKKDSRRRQRKLKLAKKREFSLQKD